MNSIWQKNIDGLYVLRHDGETTEGRISGIKEEFKCS